MKAKERKNKKNEEAKILAALREGKEGFEDDPAEEAALNEAFEKGEFKPISAARKKELMKDAAETLVKLREPRSLTLRLGGDVIEAIKMKAEKNRIPYQTLMQVVLSQFAQGKLQISI